MGGGEVEGVEGGTKLKCNKEELLLPLRGPGAPSGANGESFG